MTPPVKRGRSLKVSRLTWENLHCIAGLVLDGIHYNVLLGVNWLVYTKADLDLKTMTLKMEGEDIKNSVYLNPMAGFTAGKLKVYALKFYWLEPGARMMLEIEHGTLSPG